MFNKIKLMNLILLNILKGYWKKTIDILREYWKKTIDILREYWIDILFSFLAIFPVILSWYIDKYIPNEIYWFQRSGSLMVFFSIALEVEQSKYITRKENTEFRIGTPIHIGKELSEIRNYIKRFSIVLILIGTIIWGYGDLLFK